MKPLIVSFFLVILGYSLFFDKKEKAKQVITPMQKNSVYYDVHPVLERMDSVHILKDKTALTRPTP
jgi:tetrahydromethanopterin S-methyltransferase subunit B